MPPFTRVKLSDRIVLLRFASTYELAATFLRFQEHYESVRFRNRVFSLDEYMDWYAARYGAFTYYEDWSGFNVPSTALRAFTEGRFDPLSRRERRLLQAVKRLRPPFYVIGVASDQALIHELAHALYFTDPEYRREVRRLLRGQKTAGIRKRLAVLGYHPSVLTDEVHAYLVDGDRLRIPKSLRPVRRDLRRLFRAHAKGLTRL